MAQLGARKRLHDRRRMTFAAHIGQEAIEEHTTPPDIAAIKQLTTL